MKTDCRILKMLGAQKRHLSFHTPGHKRFGADITELSYSDNLFSPSGVIAEAERDLAKIVGADASFILTDGSTSGVHAMLWALRARGIVSVLVAGAAHPSVLNGCEIAGLACVTLPVRRLGGIPVQPSAEEIARALSSCGALLLTSPDYYGNFPPLAEAAELCGRVRKPLLIDGAHGAHLHFSEEYAGRFADMWADGVHKSLPALTQGALVSAKGEWTEPLRAGVRTMRTTSPSYPIMASVEYAVKYPRNLPLEEAAERFKRETGALKNADWSKLVYYFGSQSGEVQARLERRGVYAEFNDGNYLMFYLSPATKLSHLKKLGRELKKLRVQPPPEILTERETGEGGEAERILLREAAGRIAACDAGIFPPCLPVVRRGERFTAEDVERLSSAPHTFGVEGGALVLKEER